MTFLKKLLGILGRDTDRNLIKDYQTQFQSTVATASADPPCSSELSPISTGRFHVPVVGVTFYQEALQIICGNKRDEGVPIYKQATIIPENDNPHDANAVRIDIDSERVGYLSRRNAPVWRGKMISENLSGEVKCLAQIIWDRSYVAEGSYGVLLDIDLSLPDSRIEAGSAGVRSVFSEQPDHIEFLVNQLNRFELLNCKEGDEVDLWQKGDSKEIFIYRKNHDFGEGKIGVCPGEVCNVLLAAAGWDTLIAKIYEGGCKVVCRLLSKAEMGEEEDQDDETQTDYEPSKEEVSREMKKWMFVCEKKFDALQDSEKWSINNKWSDLPFLEQQKLKENGVEFSEINFRWMKPFLHPSDFSSAAVREVSMYGNVHWAKIIMKELRKVIRQERKEKKSYDETLCSLYNLAVASSLCVDLCNSLPCGFNNTMPSYVAYSEIEKIEIDYMKIGYRNLEALGKTDIKWLVERFGRPTEHTMTKDMYSEIIDNAVARYIWKKYEDSRSAKYGFQFQTIEQCLAEEIREGIYWRYIDDNRRAYLEKKRQKAL